MTRPMPSQRGHMPPVTLKVFVTVFFAPRSTVIAPLAVTDGTLKEYASGGPMCGLPSRLKRMRSIAFASVAVPTVERGLEPIRSWSTMIAVVRPSSTSTSGRAMRRHEALHERAVGLVDQALRLRGDRAEHERALARARDAGEHRQPPLRDLDADVLEVVHARAVDADQVVAVGGVRRTAASCASSWPSLSPSRRQQPLQHRVDAGEAALRAFLDAVLHRRVALLGRLEAHRLRQLRPLAEILELERLQVVLERLHEPRGRVDLAELALDDAVGGAEAVRAAGTDVHLLDDRAVAPPLGDQLRVGPDGEDVLARRVEDPLDADLELVRGGDGRGVHRVSFRAFDDLREAVEPLQPRADALEGVGHERARAGAADLLASSRASPPRAAGCASSCRSATCRTARRAR